MKTLVLDFCDNGSQFPYYKTETRCHYPDVFGDPHSTPLIFLEPSIVRLSVNAFDYFGMSQLP